MILSIECIILSVLFSIMIFIPLYKNPKHHIVGAFIGTILGIIVAMLSSIYLEIFNIIFL